jgi:hypothetical protein
VINVIENDEHEKKLVNNVLDLGMLLIDNKVFFELLNKLELVINVIELEKLLKIFVINVIDKKELKKLKKLKLKFQLELMME